MANSNIMNLSFILFILILLTSIFAIGVLAYEDDDQESNDTNTSNISEQSAPTPAPEPEPEPEIEAFEFVNVTPKTVKQGDILLSINFRNTGTAKLRNLLPVVVARGFSTYDVVPIPILRKRDVGTAFVSGKIDEPGDLLLTIKVGEQVFYDRITVLPL